MSAFPPKLARAASRVRERLQSWKTRYSERKISRIEQSEIADIARKTGMSIDDVRALSRLGIHGATLLRQRMAALDIDPDRLSQIQADIFREMQKSCSRCAEHGRCGYDMLGDASDPASANWKGYCPNAKLLNMLGPLAPTSSMKVRD